MSKNEKLLSKFLERPIRTDITLDEVKKLAKIIGAEILIGGRHSVHFVDRKSNTVIPIPVHGNTVGAAYINQIAKVLENQKKEGK